MNEQCEKTKEWTSTLHVDSIVILVCGDERGNLLTEWIWLIIGVVGEFPL